MQEDQFAGDVLPVLTEYVAHTFQSALRNISNVPIVAVREPEVGEWLQNAAQQQLPLNLTMTSGDENGFAKLCQTVPFQLFNYWFAVLHCFTNVLLCTLKCFSYMMLLKPPTSTLFVLVPELISNVMRGLVHLNLALYEGQAFVFEVIRILFMMPFTLSILSTAAVVHMVMTVYGMSFSVPLEYFLCSHVLS